VVLCVPVCVGCVGSVFERVLHCLKSVLECVGVCWGRCKTTVVVLCVGVCWGWVGCVMECVLESV